MNYKNVSANLCKKSIRNKISAFFFTAPLFIKRRKGLTAAAAAGWYHVCGRRHDGTLARSPQIQQLDWKNGKGQHNNKFLPLCDVDL